MVVVRTPLSAQTANITASTAPSIGQINVYDATSGNLTPSLPALSGLNVSATMIVQKYSGDASANTVTLTCAGSDTFDNATTTRTLKLSGEFEELQVISVSGTKHWKVISDGKTLASLDARYVSLSTPVLTDPTITDYVESVVAIGNTGTSKTIALTNGTVQTATLTGNCTFTMPAVGAGKSFTLLLNTGAGSFTGTFTSVKWPASTAPTITTAASRLDILTFISDGTDWFGSFAQGYTP